MIKYKLNDLQKYLKEKIQILVFINHRKTARKIEYFIVTKNKIIPYPKIMPWEYRCYVDKDEIWHIMESPEE